MTKATILIPTHNHGELIRYPIECVLSQTHSDWELFVVGDGAPRETAQLVAEYQKKDPRIRFFDNPKGERHGEAHRHVALLEATGDVVCYLSDDDLWCPGHLAYLIELLGVAEFAHTLPVQFNQDGTVQLHSGDLSLPESRQYIANGGNFIPLSHVGHTMALYRRLPVGWHAAPPGIWTDLYMWQQLLGSARSLISGHRLTVLHFPSALRTKEDEKERAAELESWFSALASPLFACS
jgi:glycosyltransferase involved in cell wall biosynthesis